MTTPSRFFAGILYPRWNPRQSKQLGILPFTAGKIPKEIYGHRMSIGGSTIPSGSILAGSPSRVVYEIPKEGILPSRVA